MGTSSNFTVSAVSGTCLTFVNIPRSGISICLGEILSDLDEPGKKFLSPFKPHNTGVPYFRLINLELRVELAEATGKI